MAPDNPQAISLLQMVLKTTHGSFLYTTTYKHSIRDYQTRQEKTNLHYFRQLDIAIEEHVRL